MNHHRPALTFDLSRLLFSHHATAIDRLNLFCCCLVPVTLASPSLKVTTHISNTKQYLGHYVMHVVKMCVYIYNIYMCVYIIYMYIYNICISIIYIYIYRIYQSLKGQYILECCTLAQYDSGTMESGRWIR